jgi:hypothetical protein
MCPAFTIKESPCYIMYLVLTYIHTVYVANNSPYKQNVYMLHYLFSCIIFIMCSQDVVVDCT